MSTVVRARTIVRKALAHVLSCSLLAAENHAFFRTFVVASTASIVALFPLLFTPSGARARSPVPQACSLTFVPFKETPIKLTYSFLWFLITYTSLARVVYQSVLRRAPLPPCLTSAPRRPPPTIISTLVHHLETLYLASLPLLQVFISIVHPLLALHSSRSATKGGIGSLEFLPMMLVSCWCGLGICYSFVKLGWSGVGWEGSDAWGQGGEGEQDWEKVD